MNCNLTLKNLRGKLNMIKKCLFAAALLLGISSQYASAEISNVQRVDRISDLDLNRNRVYEQGEVDDCTEYRTGPCVCYCPCTKFKRCDYTTTRCVQEPYCVQKRCCRYVPCYYPVQRCRYVPQYYCEQCCKYVPQYYCVPETRYRTRTICEPHCYYQPCCYTRKMCCECPSGGCPAVGSAASAPTTFAADYSAPAAQTGCCPGGSCPAAGGYASASYSGAMSGFASPALDRSYSTSGYAPVLDRGYSTSGYAPVMDRGIAPAATYNAPAYSTSSTLNTPVDNTFTSDSYNTSTYNQ